MPTTPRQANPTPVTRKKGEYQPSWAPSSKFVESWFAKLISFDGKAERNIVRNLTKAYFYAWSKVFNTDAYEFKFKSVDDKTLVRSYPVWRGFILNKVTGEVLATEIWFGAKPSRTEVMKQIAKFPGAHITCMLRESFFWMELT